MENLKKINVGASANSGDGEPIRDAFIKINENTQVLIDTHIPTKTSDLTNDSGFITASDVNLSDYYNKSEIDTKLIKKADKLNTYTKTEVDNLIPSTSNLATKAELSEYAKTIDVNNNLSTKQDKLIAGDNITIVGNVISTPNGGAGHLLKVADGKDSSYYLDSGIEKPVNTGVLDFRTSESGVSLSVLNKYAVAFGRSTQASGEYSTAFGYYTSATGNSSTAFGNLTQASGIGSTSFGDHTYASGRYSASFGHETQAYNFAETVVGVNSTIGEKQYNYLLGSPIFRVGIGKYDYERADGFVVKNDGKIYAPELSLDKILEDRQLVTKEYVDANSGGGTIDQNLLSTKVLNQYNTEVKSFYLDAGLPVPTKEVIDLRFTPRAGVVPEQLGTLSVAIGNYGHKSSGQYTFVAGGDNNTASNDNSVVIGGSTNTVISMSSAILGGTSNYLEGNTGVILGGSSNKINLRGQYNAILGGSNNETLSANSVVVGGYYNASGYYGEAVVGIYSTKPEDVQSNKVNGSPVFRVGVGSSPLNRKDGFVVTNDGNVKLPQTNTGIEMTSPNGTVFKLTVSDNGEPVFTPV